MAIAINGITAMVSASQYFFMIPISRSTCPRFPPGLALPEYTLTSSK
jgi:hypothetical protein